MVISVRQANEGDIKAITYIYNEAISAGGKTGHLESVTETDRLEWLQNRDMKACPVIVFELDKNILGYIYLSNYRAGRRAFSHVREISFYVLSNMHGKGIGKTLITYMINYCQLIDVTKLVTYVMSSNEASIGLLKKFDFEKWGTLPNVAEHQNGTDSHSILGRHIIGGEVLDADQMQMQWAAQSEKPETTD